MADHAPSPHKGIPVARIVRRKATPHQSASHAPHVETTQPHESFASPSYSAGSSLSPPISESCDFENVSQDGAIYYNRCRRCRQVLPSFDPPERSHFAPCPAAGKVVTTPPSRVAQFVRALWRWIAALCPTPIPTERRARKTACQLCPLRGRVAGLEVCQSCRCWLPAKRRFATESCPTERWPGQAHAHGRGLVTSGGVLMATCGCNG